MSSSVGDGLPLVIPWPGLIEPRSACKELARGEGDEGDEEAAGDAPPAEDDEGWSSSSRLEVNADAAVKLRKTPAGRMAVVDELVPDGGIRKVGVVVAGDERGVVEAAGSVKGDGAGAGSGVDDGADDGEEGRALSEGAAAEEAAARFFADALAARLRRE